MKVARFKELPKKRRPDAARRSLFDIYTLRARQDPCHRPLAIKGAKKPIVWSKFAAYGDIPTHPQFGSPSDRQASLVINPHALLADDADRSGGHSRGK